ncbi:MAG: exonuclease SbcCD subunit D C-terminal domain-containing protein [Tannerellaceae bacterium]|jgi:exonuclease SbcD|nr:exonuclease SbcCD subunit D C-terminal domain-containing protein [Tannerellaceae bacterium]
MKIIHTSDWHIGQTFYEYDRQAEHLLFLSWLKKQIKNENADALLIAGDIFDNPNPSAESQTIYYGFLHELTAENPQLQVVVIAGNHDSAARLEAPNPLLESMKIYVRGIVQRTPEGEIDANWLTIPLMKNNQIAAWCLAVPYLRRGDYPAADTHSEGVGKLYKYLLEHIPDKTKPVIAMGHLYASGAELSENDTSERIIVGGLDSIPPEYFPPEITYLALGHLHRSQRAGKKDNIRYAGAPLPMSFSERKNKQGILSVEIIDGKAQVNSIHFPPPVELISIPEKPGSPENVREEITFLPQGETTELSPFLEIKVKLSEPEPSLRFHIEEALKHKAVRLATIVPILPSRGKETLAMTFDELQTISPLNVAMNLYEARYEGATMPEAMQELLRCVLSEI